MADADAKLLANVQDQMSRLLSQLKDLDELRDELDDEEYEETKADTLEQLKEFEKSLRTMSAGKTTLMSDLGRVSVPPRPNPRLSHARARSSERLLLDSANLLSLTLSLSVSMSLYSWWFVNDR